MISMEISTENTTIDFCVQWNVHMDKQSVSVKRFIIFMCLVVAFNHSKLLSAAKEPDRTGEYLAKTGMSLQEIDALDEDARQFIADDLRSSGVKDWRINKDILALTKTSSEQYTVAFYINVFAFQAGSEHRIYAVYESSTGIMPTGNDSLSLSLGNSFIPYEYGGRLWYKKAGEDNWIQGGGLTADRQTLAGGTFTGRQLGDFQKKTLIKGCVYCYANEGNGDEAEVTVDYTYNPPKESSEAGLYILIVTVTVIVVLILRKRE